MNQLWPSKDLDLIKVTKIFGTAVLVSLLAACGGYVSFRNASFPEYVYDTTLTISGYLAKPEGKGPFPAVVLLHTAGGLMSHITVDWPYFLTSLDYVTLTVNSFGPRGIVRCLGVCVSNFERIKDAYGALDYLAGLPFVDKQKIGVMGFSLGARAVNELVSKKFRSRSEREFKAAVGMYSDCDYLIGVGKDIIPTVEIIGEHDTWALSCKFLGEDSPVKVHVLPGAYHAFDHSEREIPMEDGRGNTMLYSWQATNRAREITKAFLKRHLRN